MKTDDQIRDDMESHVKKFLSDISKENDILSYRDHIQGDKAKKKHYDEFQSIVVTAYRTLFDSRDPRD